MSKKLTLEEVLEKAKQSYLEKEKRANDRKAQRELKPVFARLRAFCRGFHIPSISTRQLMFCAV